MNAPLLDVQLARQLIESGKKQIAIWEEQVTLGMNLFLEKRIQQFRMEIEMLESYIKENEQ